MSRFYGSFSSDCTKQSTKRGFQFVQAHVRGWDIGVDVVVTACPICGADMIEGWSTGGSNNTGTKESLFSICSADCQK